MARRQSLAALFAFLLALSAVLGMSVLSGWHAAAVHDRPVSTALAQASEPGPAPGDAGDPIHVAGHAVGHGMAVPATDTTIRPLARALPIWSAREAQDPAGIAPGLPERPPQG